MAVFTLKAVIDHYITLSSPVYLCFLDASKAFDRVNYWCLYKKLYVPVVYTRFLIAWYCTQQFFVHGEMFLVCLFLHLMVSDRVASYHLTF